MSIVGGGDPGFEILGETDLFFEAATLAMCFAAAASERSDAAGSLLFDLLLPAYSVINGHGLQ